MKLLIGLFAIVFYLCCFTNQFEVNTPLEQLEVMEDGHLEETLTVWKWLYKGYNEEYLSENMDFGNTHEEISKWTWTATTEETEEGGGDIGVILREFLTKAMIHVVVCASKFTVIRFLLLECELTVKLLLARFVRKSS